MQNQSSPAQLLFPTVPNNYCPEGNWSDIFNSFIQLYLNNATVNIPGLGQVTPAQIATINQNIQNLQNEYNALAVNVQSGTISSPTAGLNLVTFAKSMPNTNYIITAYFVSASGTTAVPANSWSIVDGSQATTGFSILLPTVTNYTKVNWSVQSITSS
jgi:hypothetical protein